MEEQAITKKLRIAKSILSEYETQQREKQMEEKEKKLEKDQPTR